MGPFASADRETELFNRWKQYRRPAIAIYDDVRNVGLILLATGILGLFGIGISDTWPSIVVGAFGLGLLVLAHNRYLPLGGDRK